MAGVTDSHTAIGQSCGGIYLIGLYLIEKLGRRILILSSLCGVILSLIVLGLAFYLTNAVSPLAFAPVTSSSVDDCQVRSKAYSVVMTV